jgi:hypothetical protein
MIGDMQAKLDRLRTDQSGVCWWCGGVGDSREHRHKASVLRRMWGPEGLLLGRDGKPLYSIPSWRSRTVKFGKFLCQKCNNERSQTFDRAYDQYAQFVDMRSAQIAQAREIDWRDVYGARWEEQARLLGCYGIKSFGCWIAESGFQPPKVFRDFLDGGELLDTRVMLERQQSASLMQRAIHLDGESDFHRGIGVLASSGWLNPEQTRLVGCEQYAYIGDICMRFNWADGSGAGDLFWSSQLSPLGLIPASPSQRFLAVQIGVRAVGRRVRRAFTAPRAGG